MDLREMGFDDMDWIDLAEDFCEHANETWGPIKCREIL
jgi:hypothetical protein